MNKIKYMSKKEWLGTPLPERDALVRKMDAIIIRKKITLCKNKFIWNHDVNDLISVKSGKSVGLTKTQLKILKCMIDNKLDNGIEITTSDDIMKAAWEGRKPASIFTMRNMVKQIRDKTEYGILKNHSNKGYSVEVSVEE